MKMSQQVRPNVDRLRHLHAQRPLIVLNAWDAASAVLMVAAGASVIGTTSAGISWAAGVPDGGSLGRERAVEAVRAIVNAVTVPVTADIEGGYGAEPEDVGETVSAMIEAGAAGINLEDSSADGSMLSPTLQQTRLRAARAASDDVGVRLWINARTDVFLLGTASEGERIAEAHSRASDYAAAGADSLFVPGLTQLDLIAELASGPLPLNIMVHPGAPTVTDLAALGVARISVGSSIAQAAYKVADLAAREILTSGTYGSLHQAVNFHALNTMLESPAVPDTGSSSAPD